MPTERQPLRDVYSGDLDPAFGDRPDTRVVFEIHADFDPGALPRVAAILALANVPPLRVSAERELPTGLLIQAVLDGIPALSADFILRKLQQLSVICSATMTSEKVPQRVDGLLPP
jgi:hypothetical protein